MQSEKRSIDKEEDIEVYKNPIEYERYIRRRFECMRMREYRVLITPRLYYRATKDRNIAQWLENSLEKIPFCMKSLQTIVAVMGGRIVRCTYRMVNYHNVSTDVCVVDEIPYCTRKAGSSVRSATIRTMDVDQIENQAKYNSIFWTPESKSAGFHAQA